MTNDLPDALAKVTTRWREDADVARRLGHEATAQLLETCGRDVEDAWRAYLDERLSAAEAAREAGYTADYMSEAARDGRIAAEKEGGEWRFRRGDLPRKPTPRTDEPVDTMAERLLAARERSR